MALKVKLDKDSVLEFLEQRKDVLFISFLALLIILGGWFLYQKSALSVGEIIDEVIQNPSTGAGGAKEQAVVPSDVVASLLEKRDRTMYSVRRSPFGSPEEQLRIRSEVQRTYNRGVELFNAGEYQAAIEEFEKVIAMDVTETRIQYPIQPSEYMRRANREYLKANFQSMLTSAQNDIQEGDRFVNANQLQEAEKVYSRANKTLSDAITADPEGTAIGKDNLQAVQTLQQNVFKKWQTVQSNMLKSELQKGIEEARRLLAQQDLIALVKNYVHLNQIQEQLNIVDPNFTMISQNQRQPLITLNNQIQERLKDGYADLITQAEAQFSEAIANKDNAKAKESIQVLRLALTINPQDNKSLQQKISALVVQRANLLLELVDAFIAEQEQILQSNNYDQFDAEGKIHFLDELIALRNLGGNALPSDIRSKIVDRETKLKRDIRKPPELTEAYDILEVKKSSIGESWTITVRDKSARTGSRTRNLTLRPGRRDALTKITLTEVDTAGGFVILSKPGYSPTKVNLNQGN